MSVRSYLIVLLTSSSVRCTNRWAQPICGLILFATSETGEYLVQLPCTSYLYFGSCITGSYLNIMILFATSETVALQVYYRHYPLLYLITNSWLHMGHVRRCSSI